METPATQSAGVTISCGLIETQAPRPQPAAHFEGMHPPGQASGDVGTTTHGHQVAEFLLKSVLKEKFSNIYSIS